MSEWSGTLLYLSRNWRGCNSTHEDDDDVDDHDDDDDDDESIKSIKIQMETGRGIYSSL